MVLSHHTWRARTRYGEHHRLYFLLLILLPKFVRDTSIVHRRSLDESNSPVPCSLLLLLPVFPPALLLFLLVTPLQTSLSPIKGFEAEGSNVDLGQATWKEDEEKQRKMVYHYPRQFPKVRRRESMSRRKSGRSESSDGMEGRGERERCEGAKEGVEEGDGKEEGERCKGGRRGDGKGGEHGGERSADDVGTG
eukprot:450725-Hanusia_phi.AAC.2